ncbi:MAG: leucyl aminopeptidase [Pseudomonadota bacterium]
MPSTLSTAFDALTKTPGQVAVILVEPDRKLSSEGRKLDKACGGQISRALTAANFKGGRKSAIEVYALEGTDIQRLVIVGTGDVSKAAQQDWIELGGVIANQLTTRKIAAAHIIVETASKTEGDGAQAAADLALGATLRSYTFRLHRTQPEQNDAPPTTLSELVFHVANVEGAQAAGGTSDAVAGGVTLARDLVNEPANILGPVEFAERCEDLAKLGVDVEVLDDEQLRELGMDAVLAVAQGSDRPARVVVMQWQGAKSKRAKPLCFIGKGVCFDTGGISLKPASGMEDMKGDMGGAAAVVGLMHTLAARQASVNAVGVIGLVENMPSGTATRPGDIISSLSGKTIEVLNTDAEGRLVLADLLWYVEDRFSPRFMINLATLTGAIIVALGREYAGFFCNNDRLANDLSAAGEDTAEKVWRMPLAKGYDRLIDSPNADMKNIGGRNAGAVTAAQFLQRFVTDVPWAHIDVAGVAMASNKTDISPSWASGWGVRILDRLVSDSYERSS